MKYKQIIAECNPSQQHEELNDLLLEVEKIKPKVILEIGSHMGGSLKVWKEVFKPDILIGVNWGNELVHEIEGLKFIDGDSHDEKTKEQVLEALEGQEIDFLFIDGDHLFKGVKQDFEMYSPLVRKGGLVGFHDVTLTGNKTCEVSKYWPYLVKEYKTKTISHKDKYGPTATGEGLVYL